ncbi:MAG: B12-binding domain-containing radical SAM protein [Rhodospirillaceae bacterium]|jgi:anaerobic magnesium-protoporphyrin IX monomethyl ester cyclase|nr:B12-binding domain-containing radical SAM protein [Rhodospirillaceae bacterium]MBT4687932.1 B12-binding domain-containing radical SAM protein [Rhodospirillaceae bacterium]MBT5079438.1 B12-binding domain-containing radical SAM protein [Rhodospirillaceae bacterium]MBT5878447.1 B12-binding domain-containing radical SAM protein [Rhodospirillaceae bacterium]MBT7286736.1 B12-binding domain-containing radical SAM protein [Rhodospirillaceae bacterium]
MQEQQRLNKVLLINPSSKVHILPNGTPAHRKHCTPPLGLAYLAANLLAHNYEVSVIDAVAEGYDNEWHIEPYIHYGLSDDDILARLEEFAPDVVGISVLFSTAIREAHALCDRIKALRPDLPIVLGGQHPTGAPVRVMDNQNVDFVLLGEADITLIDLMSALNGERALESVTALYYRDGNEVVTTMANVKPVVQGDGWNYYNRKDAGIPTDLDGLPLPAWHVLPMEAYWTTHVRIGGGDAQRDRYAVMMSTRGCPHACYFCTSPLQSGFKGYRRRSNENVIAEIRWLRDEYGVQEIEFLDDNFYVSKPRVKKLLKEIAKEFPDMTFGVPAGTDVNALDEDVIDLMAEANFYKALLAIEAGDPELQSALIDKKVDLHRVPEVVAYLKSKGIETRALFMIGFPEETRDQIASTVKMARELDIDDFYISLVTPLPGTPLFDECAAKGILVEGFDVDNIRFSHASITLPDTSGEELETIRRVVWQENFEENRRRMGDRLKDDRASRIQNIKEYEHLGFRTLGQHAANV